MKDSLKILIYFAGLIALGALLAPPLYWGGQWLWHQVPALKATLNTDFQRYFNRSILIAAVVLLFPMLRWLKISGFRSLIPNGDPRGFRHLLLGFVLALGVMAALSAGLVYWDIWNLKNPLPWHRLRSVLITAAVVPILEEFFFRGALMGLISRTASRWWALLFVSAIYSVVHFLKPDEVVIRAAQVNWLSGFHLIPHVFARFEQPQLVLAGFTTLFVLGWTLGYAALKTRGLWYSIGLHAGIILGKFGFTKLAKPDKGGFMPWFGSDLTIGLGSVLVMLLLFTLVWASLRGGRK